MVLDREGLKAFRAWYKGHVGKMLTWSNAEAAVTAYFQHAGEGEAEPVACGLEKAARALIAARFDTYRAGNNRQVGIQDDSGEKCWIVPFDEMAALESALFAAPHPHQVPEGMALVPRDPVTGEELREQPPLGPPLSGVNGVTWHGTSPTAAEGEVTAIIHELAADIRDREPEGSSVWRDAQRILELTRPTGLSEAASPSKQASASADQGGE